MSALTQMAVQVASHASRVGVKASTDMGNGMAGFVKAEYEVNMANGTGLCKKNRTNIAGIKGNFGKIYVGTVDMPRKVATGKTDMFSDTYGDFNAIIDPDTRQTDGVFYENKFGDVGLAIAYAPNYGATTNAATGASVDFKVGPVTVAIAYENDDADAKATTGARVSYSFGQGDVHFVYNSEGGAASNYPVLPERLVQDGQRFGGEGAVR
jgi:predicted porin